MNFSAADNASGAAANPACGGGLKWPAIFSFVAAPFACVWGTWIAIPEPPSVIDEKVAYFQARPAIDTIVVGDSRAMSLAEAPFAAKGWNFFNMAVPCDDAEDVAMQLKYALLHREVRRVAMGVSFENVTERDPFELSFYCRAGPFATPEVVGFATVDEGPRPPPTPGICKFIEDDVLPVSRASIRLRWRVAQAMGRDALNAFLPNGVAPWRGIQEQIAAGEYDFKRNRDPGPIFRGSAYKTGYLQRPALAPHALRLYRKVFAALRDAKIACVVFETGRTDEFQQLIDSYPQLLQLQRQWRNFFRSESYGCVKFLDAASTRDWCKDEDFFDSIHFMGASASRLAGRLADELASIERAAAPAAPTAERARTTP